MNTLFKIITLAVFSISTAFAGNLSIENSSLGWKGSKGAAGFKLGSHYGKIKLIDGDIKSKNGNLLGGNFTVDMKNFTIEDLSGEWAKKFISHMKSSDFFSVDKYPTSKLMIKSVSGKKVIADLTINGITKPVKFDYKKVGKAFVGKMVFDRTKYNMLYGKDSSLGDKFIHHEVEITFNLVEKK